MNCEALGGLAVGIKLKCFVSAPFLIDPSKHRRQNKTKLKLKKKNVTTAPRLDTDSSQTSKPEKRSAKPGAFNVTIVVKSDTSSQPARVRSSNLQRPNMFTTTPRMVRNMLKSSQLAPRPLNRGRRGGAEDFDTEN